MYVLLSFNKPYQTPARLHLESTSDNELQSTWTAGKLFIDIITIWLHGAIDGRAISHNPPNVGW